MTTVTGNTQYLSTVKASPSYTDLTSHSVTENDVQPTSISPLYFSAFGNSFMAPTAFPPDLLQSAWSHNRDKILRSTMNAESMWSSAIFKAISKIAAMPWSLEDLETSPRRIAYYKDIFVRANHGAGWGNFISKHLLDFLLTDNGAFVELIWSTPRGGKLLGISHLDSGRCTRTGNPEEPVVYQDRYGVFHKLQRHQVLCFSDLPDPSETYFDLGLCAAHRAYKTIIKLSNMETYFDEKISGNRATALHILQGISDVGLGNAINTAKYAQQQKNAHVYMGAIVAPVMGDSPLNLVTINLKEAPDGFDPKTERDNAYMIYANAIGVPVQDIQPLSGQGLGTGTQSIVLAEAAEGQGLAAWRKQWEHMVGEYLLPSSTTFVFANNDTRDKKTTAELQKQQADTLKILLDTQLITKDQGIQLAVDIDLLPREFLPSPDSTQGEKISDNEKMRTVTPEPEKEEVPSLPEQEESETTKALASYDLFLRRLQRKIDAISLMMNDGQTDTGDWQKTFAKLLTEAHGNAYLMGDTTKNPANVRNISEYLKSQLEYLDLFAKDVQQRGWSTAKDRYRSKLYGNATKASYWSGLTQGWALPAMPADGTTECLVNCKCSWIIDRIDDDNADCYWRLGSAEHCPICQERARMWNPLRIRDGVVEV